ncbi:MAG: serine/threonine-protein kinase [Myxococcota bacterium]|nr:serine/threonine-protein kinase [Myxococcota bacterium]
MLRAGQSLGRYELLQQLGMGASAEVWRARHSALGTLHALKVLHNKHPKIRQRMLTEARVQASLKHPAVVPVQDVFDEQGRLVLVMELVDGPNLLELVQAGPVPLDKAERIFRELLEAVGHAHRQGVIHRDLKPENILLSGPEQRVRVTDFGLARVLHDDGPRATRMGVAMGTPGYMAPEMVADALSSDVQADVFSLGCILFVLCTGRVAFSGENLHVTLQRTVKGQHNPLPETLPQHLRATIEGCLIPDRAKRIPDCVTLEEVLDQRRGWGPDGERWTRPPGWQTMLLDPDDSEELTLDPLGPGPTLAPDDAALQAAQEAFLSSEDLLSEETPLPEPEPQPEPQQESLLEARPGPEGGFRGKAVPWLLAGVAVLGLALLGGLGLVFWLLS